MLYNLVRNNAYDSSKAKKELGYQTRPFADTIYDEVEWEALREGIIIPDRGQSHLEIAQAADADTQPALEVTDGSIFACTYVRTVADVDSWADMPETSYPEQSEGHERFWFSYRRIFVPENEAARSWQMAGNTVEYDAGTARPRRAPMRISRWGSST